MHRLILLLAISSSGPQVVHNHFDLQSLSHPQIFSFLLLPPQSMFQHHKQLPSDVCHLDRVLFFKTTLTWGQRGQGWCQKLSDRGAGASDRGAEMTEKWCFRTLLCQISSDENPKFFPTGAVAPLALPWRHP